MMRTILIVFLLVGYQVDVLLARNLTINEVKTRLNQTVENIQEHIRPFTNTTIPTQDQINLISLQNKVNGFIQQFDSQGKFPRIHAESRVAEDLKKMYDSILRSTIIDVVSREINEVIYERSSKDHPIEEYIARQLIYRIRLGKAIEKLNPSTGQKESIQQQSQVLKRAVVENMVNVFGEEERSVIESHVNKFWYRIDKGPDSIMNLFVKRPLTDEQYNILLETIRTHQNEKLMKRYWQNQESEKNDFQKHAISNYARELSIMVLRTFHENFPNTAFSRPSKSQRLQVLQTIFGN